MQHQQLKQATKVILSGSSAGAVGALNHGKWLQTMLGTSVKVYVLLDGGWFLPLQYASLINSPATLKKTWGGLITNATWAKSIPIEAVWTDSNTHTHLAPIAAMSVGPCAVYPACWIASQNLNAHPPILILQSRYDMEQLHAVIKHDLAQDSAVKAAQNVDKPPTVNMEDELKKEQDKKQMSALPALVRLEQRVQSFGHIMHTSLMSASSNNQRLSTWSPSCFQHEYLRDRHLVTLATQDNPISTEIEGDLLKNSNVSLYTGWDGSRTINIGLYAYLRRYGFKFPEDLNATVQEQHFRRNITMLPGVGTATTIQDKANYVAALTVWLDDGYTARKKGGYAWFDDCLGVACNPTCSESIVTSKIMNTNVEGWMWLTRIFCLLFVLTAFVFQMYLCSIDVRLFNYVRQLRAIETEFGSSPYHETTNHHLLNTPSRKLNIENSENSENKNEDKNDQSTSNQTKYLQSLSQRPATFYAQNKKSNASTTHSNQNKLDNKAAEWANNVDAGDAAAAGDAGDGLYQKRRMATLTTKNLVYDVEYVDNNTKKLVRKRVVNGISVIMNPGELIAVMGPSGSGKTTLLDCIARPAKKIVRMKGDVYINGMSMRTVKGMALHSCSIGYVRQLTTPWDPTLTVLENMVYAARLRLPTRMPLEEKLFIVSKCIADMEITNLMDSIVGGASGGGISGGQKRLLSVALQLILSPAALIMDEPTSGLDAKKAMQLVTIAKCLADQGKTVALTIHQPRPEIFCMFDRVIMLCAGSVVFQGPASSIGSYLALHPSLVTKSQNGINTLTNDTLLMAEENPADTIIDGLGSDHMQQLAIQWYGDTTEAVDVIKAIEHSNERATKYARTAAGIQTNARIQSAVSARHLDWWVALISYTGRHVYRKLNQVIASVTIIIFLSGFLTALL